MTFDKSVLTYAAFTCWWETIKYCKYYVEETANKDGGVGGIFLRTLVTFLQSQCFPLGSFVSGISF